ncbi:MAG: hypothetical protein MI866_02745, partial [Bacteroidales bacterium]|nr:hypothetical protein [Bacteroidales bacterium]
MKKLKIFGLSFAFVYILTAILCLIFGQPLIYSPIYGIREFLNLALLLGILVFLLVYINFPVLKWIKTISFKNSNGFIYYSVATLLILQIVTLLTGYMESLTTRGVEADFLYYYKCVTNSCIYILTGNITAILASRLYVKTLK